MNLKTVKEVKKALAILQEALQEKSTFHMTIEGFSQATTFNTNGKNALSISGVHSDLFFQGLKSLFEVSEFTTGDERIYQHSERKMWIRLASQAGNRFSAETNDGPLYRLYHYVDGDIQKGLRFERFGFNTKELAQQDLDKFAEENNLEMVTAEEYQKHY